MTETPGISWGYWKARNIPALARSSAGQSLTSSPSKVIVPAVTSYSGDPISADARVLLPEPLGPITAWISPARTVEVEAADDVRERTVRARLGWAGAQPLDAEQVPRRSSS